MSKLFLVSGGVFSFLSIALGAFGGHLLKNKLDARHFEIFEVGLRYQMFHSLALLLLGVLTIMFTHSFFKPAGSLFIFGTILFSGSLYALSLTGIKVFGAITPIGGVLFLVGWVLFIIAALKGVRV